MARYPKKVDENIEEIEQEQVQEAPTSNTVTVKCNLPHGMRFPLERGDIVINGNATHLRGQEMGIIPSDGRYGQTYIDESAWNEIVRIYGTLPAIKNGLIFAEKNTARANARAKEQAELRHGREPVDPKATGSTEKKITAD